MSRRTQARILVACFLAVGPAALRASAQELSQRGFAEARGTFYPQSASNDSTVLVGDALFREEATWRPAAWAAIAGGFDARAGSHDRVDRRWSVDWSDRDPRRPSFSVRRLSVNAHRSGVSLEVGKQFIRWGKADVLNPTDRFAPRDFMEVVDNDFLGVTAARVTWERGANTIDGVVARFTPSRIPLLADRWAVLPAPARGLPLVDLGARYPARAQAGLRWNHTGSRVEYSLSVYDGFNHLPLFDARTVGLPVPQALAASVPAPVALELRRVYPSMRMFGGDAAVPLRSVTIKGEAAYFTSGDARADEYAIYVVQLERQKGEWFFVGGYAGEFVTRRREVQPFAPDRGLANTFLGRAGYTIDVNRSLAFEGAVRRNGKGAWLKAEYSQAAGQHWRATARFNLIRGDAADFLGQYRRNSNLDVVLRCSF